jgi:uncharacterized protein YceK
MRVEDACNFARPWISQHLHTRCCSACTPSCAMTTKKSKRSQITSRIFRWRESSIWTRNRVSKRLTRWAGNSGLSPIVLLLSIGRSLGSSNNCWKSLVENQMNTYRRMLIMILIVISQASCGTFMTVADLNRKDLTEALPADNPPWIPQIYSGTIFDYYDLTHGDRMHAFIWDLPLSFIADTLVLPLSVYKQVRYGNVSPPSSNVTNPPIQ